MVALGVLPAAECYLKCYLEKALCGKAFGTLVALVALKTQKHFLKK